MAFVAADWSISRSTRDIRYIGDAHGGASPSYATGIEFYRGIMAMADDANSTGDDEIAVYDPVPAQRQGTDFNIILLGAYNIDDTASEYIYDCSLTQDNGDTIYDGIQVFGNADSVQVIQDGAKITNDFWNEAAHKTATADPLSSTTHRFLVKVRTGGADIDGRRLLGTQRVLGTRYTEFFIGGGTNRGNNVLALKADNDGNNNTAAGTIATWTDIVNDSEGYVGIDADGNAANEFYYSNWELGTRTKNQFYERGKWIQREGSAETIYGLNGELFRGITHEIDIDTPTGTFVEPEAISWTGGTGQLLAIDSTTAGTKLWMQLLTGVAPTDNQTITGGTSAATCLVNITVTTRTIPSCFIGTSTGSAINPGAFGVGIGADDLGVNDLLFDLTNTQRQPPNNVTFNANGLTAGEDYLQITALGYRLRYDNEASGPFTVGETLTFTSPAGTAKLVELIDKGATGYMTISEPLSGSVPTDNSTISGGTSAATADVNGEPLIDINKGQLTLNTGLTGATETSVVVSETIPTDTPTTGSIRVQNNNGAYIKCAYTSYTGSTFTITSTDFSTVNASANNNVYIGYFDDLAASSSEGFTSVYSSPRNLYISARDGGPTPIIAFETTGVLGSAGGSVNVIRNSDV